MLYHSDLSLLLHVHNYYVQLCPFYHNAANIICFTLLLYYICYTYANCNNPLHTIVYNNNMQVSWCICLHYYNNNT